MSSRNSSSIIRTRIDRVLVQLYNKDKLDRVHIGAAGLGIIFFPLFRGATVVSFFLLEFELFGRNSSASKVGVRGT